MTRQILLTISYDGTAYCGFQVQPNGVSVEGLLNEALSKIAGHPVTILGCSRTDAGVHAEGQRASFFLNGRIPTSHICNAVNGILPADIVVTKAEEVPMDFHCRHDAVGKHYRYTIRNTALTSPFDRNFCYHFPGKLDAEKMKNAVPLFLGEKDFKAFTASNSGRNDFVRRLDAITIKSSGDYIFLDFWGGGFLYKMVRSIAGSLIDIGRGYFDTDTIEKAFATGDRSLLSLTAPSKGLSLIKIYYNDEYYLDKDNSLSYNI
ncbi:MAG: tRNA pseudouridine(38-40) synthase TruA [Firmicutes bacterium]|nr:tRNA pseudouridine(38-40) synthase TruA [Bacillota bacterium]MBQ6810985.1 tRNA pseudouridine(38-40) synthase TruA [Bacillota bacterium]